MSAEDWIVLLFVVGAVAFALGYHLAQAEGRKHIAALKQYYKNPEQGWPPVRWRKPPPPPMPPPRPGA